MVAAVGFALATAPCAVLGQENVGSQSVSATGSYERFRRVRVHVTAPLKLSGQKVKVKDGKRVLGSALLVSGKEQAVADLMLPMPMSGRSYGPLPVQIDGKNAATLALPDLEAERRSLIENALYVFSSAVFSGEEFPTADFVQPSLVEDALGLYTTKTTFYDANYNVVTTVQTSGRYGAVVEVTTERAGAFKRFITLYRQPAPFNWNNYKPLSTGELPFEIGIDPTVLKERAESWDRLLANDLSIGFIWNMNSAPLLAGLHEAKPGDGSGSWNGANHRDDTWWYGLKKKLGEVRPVRYLLDLPEGYEADPNKKWPLLLFLHGSGERGNDLSLLRRHGPPKLVAQGQKLPFIVLSPQAPVNYLLGAQLIDLIDEVSAKTRVDPDRVIMTGLSSGGNSTWYTALEYPERFAAIVPIAASGNPAGAPRLKNLPVWYFVGDKDTNISPGGPQQMVSAMQSAGIPFKFTEYPGAGHGETWEKAYSDPALYEWMLAQKRRP